MAKDDNGFQQVFDIWQEGQEAFFKAQREVAENFQKSLKDLPGEVQQTIQDPMTAWNSFIKSWAPDWDPGSIMSGDFRETDAFTKGNEVFFALLEPSNWTQYAPEQLRTILNSIARGPRFADLATPQSEAAEAWRESLDYQKAAADMSKELQDAWTRTYNRYSESHSIEDLRSGNMQEALDAWLKAANAELLETQRSTGFMDAQRRMVRASTELKARQSDMAEAWCEAYQMPTRTEIDDLTKIVHELRREVRKLKRELAAAKTGGKK